MLLVLCGSAVEGAGPTPPRPLQDKIHDDTTGPSANIRLILPAVPAAWGLSTRFHRHSTTHFGSHTFYLIWLTKKL